MWSVYKHDHNKVTEVINAELLHTFNVYSYAAFFEFVRDEVFRLLHAAYTSNAYC